MPSPGRLSRHPPQSTANLSQAPVSPGERIPPMLRGEMKAIPLLLLALSLTAAAANPSAADRAAILKLAGTHDITFHFEETAAVAPDYRIKTKPYDESATEVVVVAEDTPERITLQHLLLVPGKDGAPRVIKHWAQVWTWQDTEILDYAGSDGIHLWEKVRLSEEQAAGTWSQLITQVDDSPRYEGYGRWVHENGESYWQSEPTRRPLPRREYSKRDDYDYLLVTNRHTLTPDGWIHEQDNRKVVDRDGKPAQVLCHEYGLNRYTRTENGDSQVALDWWRDHHPFWDTVRTLWIESGEAAPESFTYTTYKDGEMLSKRITRLEKEQPASESITESLRPYLIVR